jgi:hypothetical protein
MSDTASGQIFLSYRRDDTQHVAGRLFDRLAERFGHVNVFMDVDSIEPGLDFDETVARAVGGCDVLLALIGTRWLGGTDEHGQRRLDDPDDLVCLEIKAALDRDIRVIPVLIDGAAAPRRDDLPKILAPLARRNAIRLDHETFRTDIGRLIDVLDRAVQATPHTATRVTADEPPRSSVPGQTPLQKTPTAAPPAGSAPTAAPTTTADSTLTHESPTSPVGSTADTPSTPEPLLAPTHLNATAERARELDKDTSTLTSANNLAADPSALGQLGYIYDSIIQPLLWGEVVPVLGAGVNLVGRPPHVSWERGRYLPSAQELATELAQYMGEVVIDRHGLARVSQYLAAMEGEGPLYDKIHDIFDADYPPTLLHRFFARLARRTREAEDVRECMLIVTTNYDDSLERAFTDEGEPYELVTYIAAGRDRGLFRHTPASGEPTVIRVPSEYVDLRLDQRTVIVKIHGSVDRVHRADSFVITENHHIGYITSADVAGLFPVTLVAKLRTSHFLFLGYSPRDWKARVMVPRLWGEQVGKNLMSWAIQNDPDPLDEAAWDARGVDMLPVRVEDFLAAVEQRFPT